MVTLKVKLHQHSQGQVKLQTPQNFFQTRRKSPPCLENKRIYTNPFEFSRQLQVPIALPQGVV